jgi:hypothetical protein
MLPFAPWVWLHRFYSSKGDLRALHLCWDVGTRGMPKGAKCWDVSQDPLATNVAAVCQSPPGG